MRKTARVLVGAGHSSDVVETKLEGGGFSIACVPNGKNYPIYASSDDQIIKNAPEDLQESAREAWIAERLAELKADEKRIAKGHARTKIGKLEAARDEAYDVERALLWDLIWTKPTTARGLAALLGYCRERESINELIGDDEMEDVLEWTMECAACALAGLPKPPMSDIVAAAWESRQEDDEGVTS
jgi:hypothetical protein